MADDEPMSADRHFLLDVHQEELVKRMDLEDTHLLDLLKDRGVLLFTQHETVQQLPEDKKCEKVLRVLRRGTDQQYDEFCGALRETGHGHLVSHFLSKAAVDKRIRHLQHRLATYFKKTYVDDMFAYHGEGYRVPLEGLYQPLQWVEHDRSRAGTTTKLLDSYLDLFNETGHDDDGGHFIITAEANGGKTTMLRRICHDWAEQHLGGAPRQNLSRFVVVIPIILRAVKQGASLIETIKQQLGLTGKDDLTVKDVKTLIYCLQTGKDENCFIKDGLDEYPLDKSEEVTALMSGELYPSSWCIITSRPEGASCVNDWPNVVYREAELKGFSEVSIRKYVEEFFSATDPGLGHRLLDVISPIGCPLRDAWSELGVVEDTHVGLLELASNPGRLALICIIYAENKTLPTTKEQLTQEFVRFMLCRWQHKREPGRNRQQSRLGILNKYKDILLIFGKLASETDGGKMKLVFKYEELIKLIDPDLMKIGLIYKSHPVSRISECEYSFVHKSIQEYLAAFHLYYSKADSTTAVQAVVSELLEIYRDMRDTSYDDQRKYLAFVIQVWVMCDYLPLQQLSLLLTEAFNQQGQWKTARNLLTLLLRALSHAPLAQMTLPEPVTVKRGRVRRTFQLPIYSVYHVGQEKQQLAPPAVRILHLNNQILCELTWSEHPKALRVEDATTGDNDELKIDAYRKSHQKAVLTYYHQLPLLLKGPTVEHLELNTAGRTTITSLNDDIKSTEIWNSQLRGKGAWLAHTLTCLNCHEISIQTCGLQKQDLQTMARYMEEQHSSLAAKKLYVNKNNLHGAGEEIVKLLQHMPRLSTIDLRHSCLSGKDILEMTAQMEKHHSSLVAKKVYFSNNDWPCGGQDPVKLLEHRSHSTALDPERSQLSTDDLQEMDAYLEEFSASALQEAENPTLDSKQMSSGGKHNVKLLQHMPRSTPVDLAHSGRSGVDNQEVDAYPKGHPRSVASETAYQKNNDSSGSGQGILHLPQHMPRLSTIYQDSSRFSGKDTPQLSACSEEYRTSVEEASLTFNNDLSGAGQDIVNLLQYMPQLEFLDLRNCNLSEEDMDIISLHTCAKRERIIISFL